MRIWFCGCGSIQVDRSCGILYQREEILTVDGGWDGDGARAAGVEMTECEGEGLNTIRSAAPYITM